MYKMLIKQLHTRRLLFETYMVNTIEDNGGETIESTKEYSIDDLLELAEKHKQLLSEYTTEQIRVVEDLDVEMIMSVLDN